MKSTLEQLKKRGFVPKEERRLINSIEERNQKLNSKEAYDRSQAIYMLDPKEDFEILIHSLMKEKALYTKLSIMDKLESGDESVLKRLVIYLGKIGDNQLKEIEPSSKKISYPLPRDIVARIMGHMNPSFLPLLMNEVNESCSIEILDAIGFIAFYGMGLDDESTNFFIRFYQNKPLFWKWRIITVLSSSKSEKATQFLKGIEYDVLNREAARSLMLIQRRKK